MIVISRITRHALDGIDNMHHDLPILGYSDFEEQRRICLGEAERFAWYKPFVCPLSVSGSVLYKDFMEVIIA